MPTPQRAGPHVIPLRLVEREGTAPNTSLIPFVGRHQQLGMLSGCLANAREGEGRLVLVSGESGIGKSRLAEELGVAARATGMRVVWGHCYANDGAPILWPWIQILRAIARDGERAAELTGLVGKLGDGRPGFPDIDVEASAEARFRLFDAIAGFLITTTATRPLLLVLDDLQWADTASILVLEFLARALEDSHTLVVALYDEHTSPDHGRSREQLARLAGNHRIRRVALAGLNPAETGELASVVAGRALPAEILSRLHEDTAGNPFFIGELVRLLATEERPGSPTTPGLEPRRCRPAWRR